MKDIADSARFHFTASGQDVHERSAKNDTGVQAPRIGLPVPFARYLASMSSDSKASGGAPRPMASLFRTEASRSNVILARTVFNEMVRSGRQRNDILEFVNCLLELVVSTASREGFEKLPALIDPHTGFPTRSGFYALLLHELDPAQHETPRAGLVLIALQRQLDLELVARKLQHLLRGSDVVVPLRRQRMAALVYPRELGDLEQIETRITDVFERNLGASRSDIQLVSRPLEPGESVPRLWRSALRQLRLKVRQLPNHG